MSTEKKFKKAAVGLMLTGALGFWTVPEARGEEKALNPDQQAEEPTLVPEKDEPSSPCVAGDRECIRRWYYMTEKNRPDAWEADHPAHSKRQRWYHVGKPEAPPRPRIIVLEGVRFDFDKATIRPESFPILDQNLPALQENVRVKVMGHADSRGTDEYNQRLSTRRAEAIRDYYIQHGVPADRLEVEGRGESEPIAVNEPMDGGGDTPAEHAFADPGRAKNRRIELHIQDVVAASNP